MEIINAVIMLISTMTLELQRIYQKLLWYRNCNTQNSVTNNT